MSDSENAIPPSKKRTAGRQLTRENPGFDDDDDTSEQETGTFKKASDEVLASRRIVKVRRQQTSSTPSAPSTNPFAGIRLVPPTNSSATPADATTAEESRKPALEDTEEKNGVDKETDKGEDEKDKKLEGKIDEAGSESTAEKEKAETEEESDQKDSDEGKDENNKKLESKCHETGTESTMDKEKIDTVSEATKPESVDVKTEGVDKTEDEAKTDTNDEKNGDTNDEKNGDTNDEKNGDSESKASEVENVQKDGETTPFSSFQQLSSSQNAFTGLVGSGFSSTAFSFGPISTDGSLGSGLFGADSLKNGNSSVFGHPGVSVANKSEGGGVPTMQEVTVETGEENERTVFSADSVLFEFLDGGWKERGKGEVKVNVSTVGTGKARLVMRARGNYRLILNASLYADMKLAAMEKKGITFACVNSNGEEKKEGLSTFALKFREASIVEEFHSVVTEHKGKTSSGLKTPENSP